MAIFDGNPLDTEPATLGASRIRDVKTTLNTLLGQMFSDSLTFLAKWVTGSMIQNDASNDSLRAISSDHIKTAALTIGKFPTGVFTADAPGRAPFANGVISTAQLDPAIVFPSGSVTTAAIADGAVTSAKIAAAAVGIAQAGTGVVKVATGSWAGSNSSSQSVSGLAFQPDALILYTGTLNGIGFALRSAGTDVSVSWDNGSTGSPFSGALTWASDGFTYTPSNNHFNLSGKTTYYVALKF